MRSDQINKGSKPLKVVPLRVSQDSMPACRMDPLDVILETHLPEMNSFTSVDANSEWQSFLKQVR